MNCPESTLRLIEYLETNAADHAAMAAHLADCPACQATARRWQNVEAALARTLKAPTLPDDFIARLQQRLATEIQPMRAEEVARRKQQLQAEYETGLVRLRNGKGSLPSLDPATKLLTAVAVVLPAVAALAAQGLIRLPATIGPVNTNLVCFVGAGIGIALAAWLPLLRPAWQRWF